MLSRLPGEEERPRKVSEVRGSKAQGLHEGEGKGRGGRKGCGVGGGLLTVQHFTYMESSNPKSTPTSTQDQARQEVQGACPSHRVDSKSTQVDPNNLLRSSQLPFHSWEN